MLLLAFLGGSPGNSAAPNQPAEPALVRLHVELELRPDAIASLRATPRHYVKASVRMDQLVFPDVGLRLKGSVGSFRPIDDKPGFTLDFGRFVPGQASPAGAKVHLNNSVEDPSFLHEPLGGEVFRAAGVPTPRTGHAVVTLNGRRLGLYVLQEGFTEAFLTRHFGSAEGVLYDTDDTVAGLASLNAAAAEPNLARRWEQLGGVIDLDRFITFLAVEVMLGHHDGYAVARNNFRIYQDPRTAKLQFLPHGMDQLFVPADFPWEPHMGGPVAAAVMAVPEGRRQYAIRFASLFTNVFVVSSLTNRVRAMTAELRPLLTPGEFAAVQHESIDLMERIRRRKEALERQLAESHPAAPVRVQGPARLTGWTPVDVPEKGAMEVVTLPDVGPALHVVAGPMTSASWRTKVRLSPGHYRFIGRARTARAIPLPFGGGHGAGLRVIGGQRSKEGMLGDSSWRVMAVEFEVKGPIAEMEVLCEFYASRGEAWFDQDSLRIETIP